MAENDALRARVQQLHEARDGACADLASEKQLRRRAEADLAKSTDYSRELEALVRLPHRLLRHRISQALPCSTEVASKISVDQFHGALYDVWRCSQAYRTSPSVGHCFSTWVRSVCRRSGPWPCTASSAVCVALVRVSIPTS